jgi:hypothetical protein
MQDSLIAGGMNKDVAKATASLLTAGASAAIAGAAGGVQGATTGFNVDLNNRQLHPSEAKLIKDNAKAYAEKRGISIDRAEAELNQQALRNDDSAHAERLGSNDPNAQAFLKELGAGKTMVDPLTGQSYQLFAADEATRNNHAMFGQYAKTSPVVMTALDRAYDNAFKPKGGQTISGVNGSNPGALTGSDLALMDAATDYRNMRSQPAVVQWAVLGQLREERRDNKQAQSNLLQELQQMNQRGEASPQAADRRGEIVKQLTQLEQEDSSMRRASVEQIRAMGSTGLLKPIDQREWGEGVGEAIAASRLSFSGVGNASISGRIAMLKEAIEEAKAASVVAKAQADAMASLSTGQLKTDWNPKRVYDEVITAPKGSKPPPEQYLTPDEIKNALSPFDAGVVKIKANAPTGTEGPPGGTFVMPKAQADAIIKQANGDVAVLERLLGLKPGDLGTNPVRVDIPNPQGLRVPSGNERGANEYWVPGGRTSGGIREATVDPVPPGKYNVKKVF